MWKNIIFDFDGVIAINSQALQFEELEARFYALGLNIKQRELFERYLGWRGGNMFSDIEKRLNITLDREILYAARKVYQAALFERIAIDPALSAVLTSGAKCYVCSANEAPHIMRIFATCGLDEFFNADDVFGHTEGVRLKPHPDIYLACIDKYALDKQSTCAMEDSVTGVQAAVAAGLYTYGYTAGIPDYMKNEYSAQLRAAGANKIINSMKEILL